MLANWGVPKDLIGRFDQYETQANSSREELKELAKEVAVLRAENNTVRCFFTDRLLNIYENLSIRDVETTEALRTILTLHRDEHRLNQQLREAMNRLETLIGQPLSQTLDQANTVLPPLPAAPSSPHQPNASNPAGTALATDSPIPIQASKKRDTSSRPEDIDGLSKRRKV